MKLAENLYVIKRVFKHNRSYNSLNLNENVLLTSATYQHQHIFNYNSYKCKKSENLEYLITLRLQLSNVSSSTNFTALTTYDLTKSNPRKLRRVIIIPL